MDTTPGHEPQGAAPATPQPSPITAETITVTPTALLPQPSFFVRNKANLIAGIIALVLLAGAGYYFYSTKYASPVVAVVNGTKIYEKEFNESVALIEQDATLRGADVTDEAVQIEIRNQALSTLIDNTLILTAAREAGITASAEEVQSTYDMLATQNGGAEQLAARMAELGITEEQLKKNINDRILADAYVEQATDIETLTVSDEEITQFIDEIKAGNPEGTEFPPLEEIKPQVESQLLMQKQQELMRNFLAELREKAKIEMKI